MKMQQLERSCMNRLSDLCRIDGQPCSMCAQWRCADAELVEEVYESVNGRENRASLSNRKVAEYYDLLMTNESIQAAFSTREILERGITPSRTVQANISIFEPGPE
jgi:hypothetical protein